MSLGTFTILDQVQGQGPVVFARCSIVGDSAYAAGGTTGLLAKLRAALLSTGLTILSVQADGDNAGYTPTYVVSTDKLKVWTGSAGVQVEDTTSNQSGRTYNLLIIAY